MSGGLIVISKSIQGLFVKACSDGQFLIETRVDTPDGTAQNIVSTPLGRGVERLQLRVDLDPRGGATRFSYWDGRHDVAPVAGTPILKNGYWKGAKIGLCATGPEGGCVDVADCVYEVD